MTTKCIKDLAPFLRSLRTILDHESDSIMRWTHDGRAFEILDMDQMQDYILPKYFKHRKHASFQRQLNYFGFRKWTKSRATTCTFSNKFFQRDQPELMWSIGRKRSTAHTRQREVKVSPKVTVQIPKAAPVEDVRAMSPTDGFPMNIKPLYDDEVLSMDDSLDWVDTLYNSLMTVQPIEQSSDVICWMDAEVFF